MKNLTKRKRIHYRVRRKVRGTGSRPRLCVYRSNKNIFCQLIDDNRGETLASASSRTEGVDPAVTKKEQARKVGAAIAEKARSMDISEVVFDRSGYLYHGRVRHLAEGAREGGLKF